MIPENMPNPFTPGRVALHPMPPLQYAVYNIFYAGSEPILALLEAGAELDAVDENGYTALHQAILEREPEIYALLVSFGADQQLSDRFGETPAMFFKDVFGVTCEEKFKGNKIDADYFRRKHEEKRRIMSRMLDGE